eukprot:3796494-Amphidinium_carterae.1
MTIGERADNRHLPSLVSLHPFKDQRHKLLHSTVSSESPLAPGVVVTVEGANAGPHTTDVDENGKVTVRSAPHMRVSCVPYTGKGHAVL